MKSKVKSFLALFAIQSVLYTVFIINYRAIAQGQMGLSVSTDVFLASAQFFLIRKISQMKDTYSGFAGYLLGSIIGTILGIEISKLFLGM
jgi:hypothetical protein